MTAQLAYLLYAVFALGALGVYLVMPHMKQPARMAGLLFGLAALAGALVVCARLFTPPGTNALFYVFAAIALVASVKMISHEKPVYSALYFVLVVLAVAALLLLQMAEFLAVALVIVYAGAILVTYVFVIMLAQQSGRPIYDCRAREPFMAVLIGFVAMAAVAGQLGALPEGQQRPPGTLVASAQAPADAGGGMASNTERVGRMLMADYAIALELAGVLLLVAMIGAIAMSKKRVPVDVVEPAQPPPGQIGREVPPF